MTINEAADRAVKIWGAANVIKVERSPSGNFWWVVTKDYDQHVLKADGSTECHPQCAKAKEASDQGAGRK